MLLFMIYNLGTYSLDTYKLTKSPITYVNEAKNMIIDNKCIHRRNQRSMMSLPVKSKSNDSIPVEKLKMDKQEIVLTDYSKLPKHTNNYSNFSNNFTDNMNISRLSQTSSNNFKISTKESTSPFKLYFKEGFIKYIEDLIFFLSPKEVSELGFDLEMLKEIEKLILKGDSPGTVKIKSKVDLINLTNIEEEGSISDNSSYYDVPTKKFSRVTTATFARKLKNSNNLC